MRTKPVCLYMLARRACSSGGVLGPLRSNSAGVGTTSRLLFNNHNQAGRGILQPNSLSTSTIARKMSSIANGGETTTPAAKVTSVQLGQFPQSQVPHDFVDFSIGQPSHRLMNLDGFRDAVAKWMEVSAAEQINAGAILHSENDHNEDGSAGAVRLQYGAQQGYAGFRHSL